MKTKTLLMDGAPNVGDSCTITGCDIAGTYKIREIVNTGKRSATLMLDRIDDDNKKAVARQLRSLIEASSSEERLEVWNELMRGFCRHCGSDNPRCQCWNDE